MIASIAAIFVAVWFYQTAEASGQKTASWIAAGTLVYFFSALFWSYFINPSIKDSALHNPSAFLIFVVQYAYIAFALICTAGFKIMMSKKENTENSST